MKIEKPWEEFFCDKCTHCFQEDMCNAYIWGLSYIPCPRIRDCEKFEENKKLKDVEKFVKLTTSESGDWQILEVNGTEWASGHSISEDDWLELLRVHFNCHTESECISDEEMESRC